MKSQCLDAANQCILLLQKKTLVLVKILVILKKNKPRGRAECADGSVHSSLPGKDDRKYRGEDILLTLTFLLREQLVSHRERPREAAAARGDGDSRIFGVSVPTGQSQPGAERTRNHYSSHGAERNK